MLTTLTIKSMGYVIIVVVAVHQHVKRQCVLPGAVAKKYLKQVHGIEVRAYLSQMGAVKIDKVDWQQIEQNAFFCPDVDKVDAFDELNP